MINVICRTTGSILGKNAQHPAHHKYSMLPPIASRCLPLLLLICSSALLAFPFLQHSLCVLDTLCSFHSNNQGSEAAERSEVSEATLSPCEASFQFNRQGERSEVSEATLSPCEASFQIGRAPSEPSEARRARPPFLLVKLSVK